MTSLFVNAAFAPTPAVPVVYKERPLLQQVDAKAVAKELLTPKQYRCLTKLVGKESAWKPSAANPTSSAKGIGQLLAGTYSSMGMRHVEAGVSQLVATLSYITRRHKTPCGAWSFFQEQKKKTGIGWY